MDSKELAWKIKRHGIEMTHLSNGSHIGAILSVADIVAVLYANILNVSSDDPKLETRDRLILSKGHAGAAIYAALAEKGFFSIEELKTHYANGSRLSGHVSHKGVPGVEFSTGSLGHGLSVGVGMAYAAKKDHKNHRVFVIIGDGECNEGSIWEAAMFAHHYELNNLVCIIDHNKMASLDFCENSMKISPLKEKWEAFGWHVIEADGHDHSALTKSLNTKETSKPLCIVAHTIKGKDVSFMENNILWHYRPPKGEEYLAAIEELEAVKP